MPKPFSTKAKKHQLAAKRERLRTEGGHLDLDFESSNTFGYVAPVILVADDDAHPPARHRANPASVASAPTSSSTRPTDPRRSLTSVFAKVSPAEMFQRKKESQKPLVRLPQTSLEIGFADLHDPNNLIDFPQRPAWSPGESKECVEEREEKVFQQWLHSVYEKWNSEDLSYFEHNLEVWRQLWRVVEISDIVLFVVDARHPILHFPPTLFDYVVTKMKKKLVLVFNKIDLIDAPTLSAWEHYFKSLYPGLHTASFSVYPPETFLPTPTVHTAQYVPATRTKLGKRVQRYVRSVGVASVLKACRDVEIFDAKGHLVDWETMISQQEAETAQKEAEEVEKRRQDLQSDLGMILGVDELASKRDGGGRRQQNRMNREREIGGVGAGKAGGVGGEDSEDSDEDLEGDGIHVSNTDNDPRTDMITIGLIGHPNVGKSSLINGILGKKVVSTSSTPGHTKHFQTIHLTKTLRLCDCPGLVFPALLPKPLQILSGMYKISQVQEPYSAIQYLASHVPIEQVLHLQPPLDASTSKEARDRYVWSAWDICEAFALQRGFLTPKAARPDVYRAANLLLRMANDGRLLMGFKPPGYFRGLEAGLVAGLEAEEGFKKGGKGVESGGGVESGSSEEESEESEEDVVAVVKSKAKGNAFALLSLDDDDE
ncbi:Guanine nucleotide-binding-like protein 1 [Podochytrium sp. JEL0797]|nr:Guanine nucleotide-binding-like protein 1 [Podochytrium sp. JEL0797]